MDGVGTEEREPRTANGVAVLPVGAPGEVTWLTQDLLTRLHERLDGLHRDPGVRVLVLMGRGRAFAVGADREAIETLSDEAVDAYLRTGQDFIAALRGSRLLTIAAVNGLAFGGGMELALACDVRWTHRRAAFELPECRSGLLPAWGATRLLRGAVPASLAVEILMGRRITAGEALRAGLVSRLFTGEHFDVEVVAAAERLAVDGGGSVTDLMALWRHDGSLDEHAFTERRLFSVRRSATRGQR
jgi:enoyl-CoA hydratase